MSQQDASLTTGVSASASVSAFNLAADPPARPQVPNGPDSKTASASASVVLQISASRTLPTPNSVSLPAQVSSAASPSSSVGTASASATAFAKFASPPPARTLAKTRAVESADAIKPPAQKKPAEPGTSTKGDRPLTYMLTAELNKKKNAKAFFSLTRVSAAVNLCLDGWKEQVLTRQKCENLSRIKTGQPDFVVAPRDDAPRRYWDIPEAEGSTTLNRWLRYHAEQAASGVTVGPRLIDERDITRVCNGEAEKYPVR